MYLVLSQQYFDLGATNGSSSHTMYYGAPLYLSIDMTHFIYKGQRYDLSYSYTEPGVGATQSPTRSLVRGAVHVNYKKHFYDVYVPGQHNTNPFLRLVVVQTSDVNTYLHNKFEFSYVIFSGMRFDMII